MKKRKIWIAALMVSSLTVANAQEATSDSLSNWTIGGNASLTVNQLTFTNWAAGGKNSVSGAFNLKSYFNYKKNKVSWDNSFDLGYGLVKQGTDNAMKSDDKLQFASKYGYQASSHWYYTGLVDFKTQMDKGYKDAPINSIMTSTFLAPAYLTYSLGMDYKPSANFSLYLSPITSKMTIVNQDSLSSVGAFGVEPGDKTRSEFGAFVKMVARKKDLVKNVDFYTRVDLFSNLAENAQNIDVDWETTLNLRVNQYLSAIVSVNLLYDDDVKYVDPDGVEHGPRTQFKQLVGLGLNYKFGK
ncbi:uncharacterized protein DUF481 [Breznakibacter xylanolyticus]|uniref:Uncharacterized protein DUF481 n=1 Tax=Breznakibacter xylanolyticus TaxID=990 RepID=A0A2W7MWC6_9BACT|nr:DUF3078 domain-containing protein [Breznakibacter xylanolyticus]MBN2744375.1 DUF3078 domain-containing protein [Marinilabiliaceae bacterium]PZX12248.1 uncharacterized protein DUF481 [Breznakibacter xylanolyticus]